MVIHDSSTAVRFGRHSVLVDDRDIGLLSQHDWAVNGGYLKRRPIGKDLFHRMVMQPPAGMVVDHINGNSLDNRRANLRVCTPAENSRNRRLGKNSRTGVKGVYLDGRKDRRSLYVAEIKFDHRKYWLGRYETREEAASAYRIASEILHGEYARRDRNPAQGDMVDVKSMRAVIESAIRSSRSSARNI